MEFRTYRDPKAQISQQREHLYHLLMLYNMESELGGSALIQHSEPYQFLTSFLPVLNINSAFEIGLSGLSIHKLKLHLRILSISSRDHKGWTEAPLPNGDAYHQRLSKTIGPNRTPSLVNAVSLTFLDINFSGTKTRSKNSRSTISIALRQRMVVRRAQVSDDLRSMKITHPPYSSQLSLRPTRIDIRGAQYPTIHKNCPKTTYRRPASMDRNLAKPPSTTTRLTPRRRIVIRRAMHTILITARLPQPKIASRRRITVRGALQMALEIAPRWRIAVRRAWYTFGFSGTIILQSQHQQRGLLQDDVSSSGGLHVTITHSKCDAVKTENHFETTYRRPGSEVFMCVAFSRPKFACEAKVTRIDCDFFDVCCEEELGLIFSKSKPCRAIRYEWSDLN
ncbi:hypothetical protein F5146DRAFT_1149343 [Armillaria mellea]|nr:hypothetical protein F5146DRAFT_1149343 [Armillaria mellea]